MYNSPATPTGTGSRAASNTYTRVPAIGVPIGAAPSPCNGALIVAHTVLSVGPYALIIRRPGLHCAISAAGHASPATTRHSSARSSVLLSVANTAGGSVAWLMRCSTSRWRNPSPLTASAGVSTKAAPLDSAISVSHAEASKLKVANCSTRECRVTFRRSTCAAANALRPACVTTTPLGVPVEPEV